MGYHSSSHGSFWHSRSSTFHLLPSDHFKPKDAPQAACVEQASDAKRQAAMLQLVSAEKPNLPRLRMPARPLFEGDGDASKDGSSSD
eukprot:SM000166S02455  [mRNA]  locus=s166:70216:70786:+ [translate_table: standard]